MTESRPFDDRARDAITAWREVREKPLSRSERTAAGDALAALVSEAYMRWQAISLVQAHPPATWAEMDPDNDDPELSALKPKYQHPPSETVINNVSVNRDDPDHSIVILRPPDEIGGRATCSCGVRSEHVGDPDAWAQEHLARAKFNQPVSGPTSFGDTPQARIATIEKLLTERMPPPIREFLEAALARSRRELRETTEAKDRNGADRDPGDAKHVNDATETFVQDETATPIDENRTVIQVDPRKDGTRPSLEPGDAVILQGDPTMHIGVVLQAVISQTVSGQIVYQISWPDLSEPTGWARTYNTREEVIWAGRKYPQAAPSGAVSEHFGNPVHLGGPLPPPVPEQRKVTVYHGSTLPQTDDGTPT